MQVFDPELLKEAPEGFQHRAWSARDLPGAAMTIQVAPDDCTGCGICVDVCPARSKSVVKHKAINMEPIEPHLARERENFDFFLGIPEPDRSKVQVGTIKGSQMMQPLFEFSGACAGCGETPYLKLLTQLFGDRLLIANATGCSSIYGGNLPTTPWATNDEGRGPAWSNSLFEDNAEFGLGMRLGVDQHRALARVELAHLSRQLGESFARELLDGSHSGHGEVDTQRKRVQLLKEKLSAMPPDRHVATLLSSADYLVDKSVWIVGGDGWAYDIGFGGLDHVLASGRNVNVLVLDTEVYSNTGGQSSKATPRAAVAKFAAAGKHVAKKDLGMEAATYGDVYVAKIAIGADNAQTVKAFVEAERHKGPSLIIAYSHCIAHGINMSTAMTHQREAVASGYWPLYRFLPDEASNDGHPFHLDSKMPTLRFRDFALKEARFGMLPLANAAEADELMNAAQADIDERWSLYSQTSGFERHAPPHLGDLRDAAAPDDLEATP